MAVETPQESNVDVVIIGGGPTGLLSALLLQQLGVSVTVIDAKPGPLDLGRADALNARTQQYLRVVGILDELLEQGLRCNTSSTFSEGEFKSRQNEWWTSITHCEFPNFLMIGQPVVEEVIFNRLAPGTVHHGEQVTFIEEEQVQDVDDDNSSSSSSSSKSVLVKTSTGRSVRAQYAIAADGARSAIRSALGISFTGTKPEMTWAVLDTFIDTDFPRCPEIITFQLNGQSRVAWIPRERGMARFYVLLDGEITQEKAQESVRQHLAPHKIEFTETEWFSTFEIKERIASTFISRDGTGRVFLAGDSAHVHSVNGGQGLNTGIADAFALSWRLASVVNSGKSDHDSMTPDAAFRVLHSYDTERRAVAQDVINVAAVLVRDTMHTAKQYVSTIQKNAGYITGMGVSYASVGSELIVPSSKGIWTAGQRCPDILVSDAGSPDANLKRLYSVPPYGKWLSLSIGSSSKQETNSTSNKDVLHYTILPAASSKTPSSTTTNLEVGSSPSGVDGVFTSEDVVTIDQQQDGGAGDVNTPFVVVVRPDMYVGYVGDAKGAESYLAETH